MNIFSKFKKQKKQEEAVRFINPKELDEKVECYTKARGITKEELEAPILEVLNITDLETAIKFLNNCDLNKYNSIQLEIIAKHLDELQVLYAEKCKLDRKKTPIVVAKSVLLGLGISGVAGLYFRMPVTFVLPFLGLIGSCIGALTVGAAITGVDDSYFAMMKELDDVGEKILLVANAKSQEKIVEKETVKEKSETLQDRVNRIYKEIGLLPSSKKDLLYNILMNILSEYQRCFNIGKECDITLLMMNKPYYEYILEQELDKLESKLRKAKDEEIAVSNFWKVFEDYKANVTNFTDKKEALVELMNMTKSSFDEEDDIKNIELLAKFGECFWKTISVTKMFDRIEIIQALDYSLLSGIIKQGEILINNFGSEEMKKEIATGKQQANVDEKMYLLLLVSTFDKLDFDRKENKGRARDNKALLATS